MDNDVNISVRIPLELKEKAKSYAEMNSISLSTLVREAMEARMSPIDQDSPSKGELITQDVLKQIRYLYYLVDNDDTADDYQTNLVIRKEVKVLWKMCCQNLASETRASQKETTQS